MAREISLAVLTEEGAPGLQGVSVVHYRWNGGGHGAPPAIDGVPASEVVWRFLAGYSLAQTA